MAERRMFALKIIDSDAFLDMPSSTQNLYFHLSMRADDDGFISSPKKVMRMINASDDDMKILLSKRFLLSFDTGIVVIKHWRLHNYIAKDRYTETIYKEEKEKLFTKENGSYTDHPELVAIPYTDCIQTDDTGKVSEGKVSEGKVNNTPEIQATVSKPKRVKKPVEEKKPYGIFNNVFLSDSEYDSLQGAYGGLVLKAAIICVSEYVQSTPSKHYTDFNKVMLNWGIQAGKEAIQSGKVKPERVEKAEKFCTHPTPSGPCGGRIKGSACIVCFTNYGINGEEI